MKKLWLVVLAFVLVASCTFAAAANVEYEHGEVIYHQNFSDISDFGKSGVKIGTLSTQNASYICDGAYLNVQTGDSGRAYNILPDIVTGSNYTVEFSFKFTDTSRPNGYVAFMLTCRGDEPTNMTPITFRADGTIDDFSDLPAELTEAIASGEEVQVTIPVEDDVLYNITVAVGDAEYTVERDSMLMIADGGMGFMYRYIGVSISEIYIVNGVGYTEKLGHYADNSFSTDESPVVVPDDENRGDGSPTTGDSGLTLSLLGIAAAGGVLTVLAKRAYRERRFR